MSSYFALFPHNLCRKQVETLTVSRSDTVRIIWYLHMLQYISRNSSQATIYHLMLVKDNDFKNLKIVFMVISDTYRNIQIINYKHTLCIVQILEYVNHGIMCFVSRVQKVVDKLYGLCQIAGMRTINLNCQRDIKLLHFIFMQVLIYCTAFTNVETKARL